MKCPICDSKNTTFFANKDSYIFYRCSACKAIFLSHLPSEIELENYYKKNFSYADGLLNEQVIRKRGREIIKSFRKIYPQAKTICDVGSGYGFFLDEARDQGYDITGIEPSKQLARSAKKNLSISIFTGDLKTYIDKYRNQFDIVTCIHVIEHVRNPNQFIRRLISLVKVGGILYIETPNSDSHLLYVEKEKYTFLIPPDHLWLLSRFSIEKMLPSNVQIVVTRTYSYSEHLMGIVKRILRRNRQVNSESNTKANIGTNINVNTKISIKKKLFYYLFDYILAPLFTGTLNLYHKGSILELYIKKKRGKCRL